MNVVPEPLCLVKRTAAITTAAAPPPAAGRTRLFLYRPRWLWSGWACAQ